MKILLTVIIIIFSSIGVFSSTKVKIKKTEEVDIQKRLYDISIDTKESGETIREIFKKITLQTGIKVYAISAEREIVRVSIHEKLTIDDALRKVLNKINFTKSKINKKTIIT